jgi:nicotinamide mononucleotide transporter
VTRTGVIRIDSVTAAWCLLVTLILWTGLWLLLDIATDSPVPGWDGLIASLSVVATWMLTRKYLEQWYVWIVANAIAVVVYLAMEMYPTAMLFLVYFGMAIIGVRLWSRSGMGRIKN